MRWGLIPRWAKDSKIGSRLINARAETLAQKPSFHHAFKHRRCLILADGFYEWKRVGNRQQPYYFQLKNGQPFALAGLWEIWQPREGEAIASCAIVTTKANLLMQSIHNRMPVILEPDSYHQWLDSHLTDADALKPLLKPYESELLSAVAVSSLANNPANDLPALHRSLLSLEVHDPHQKLEPQQAAMVSPPTPHLGQETQEENFRISCFVQAVAS